MTTTKSDPLRHYKAIKKVAETRKVLRDIYRRDLTEYDLRALRAPDRAPKHGRSRGAGRSVAGAHPED